MSMQRIYMIELDDMSRNNGAVLFPRAPATYVMCYKVCLPSLSPKFASLSIAWSFPT
jgi:hypothetical protein